MTLLSKTESAGEIRIFKEYCLAFSFYYFTSSFDILQLSSMGMMTEYYHFFFTTLVSYKNAQVKFFLCFFLKR